jgi:hypothetical protein
MRIISCGSSFSSLEPKLPNTHYTEILAKELGAELINIAKPGSSNFAIRLQIETAIAMKPDLITFEFASASRIDLPLSAFNEDGNYDSKLNAHNLRYTNYHSVVDKTIDQSKESIVSDGIRNFIDGVCFPANERLTPNSRRALEYWFTELYDEDLKYHQDYFTCTSAFLPLENSGIPYIWTRGDMCMFDWSIYNNEVPEGGNMWLGNIDPTIINVYHTSPEVQEEIAKHWVETYRKMKNSML